MAEEKPASQADLVWWLRHTVIDEAHFVLSGKVGVNTEHAHLSSQTFDPAEEERWHRCYDHMCVQTYVAFAKAAHAEVERSVSASGRRVMFPETSAAVASIKKRQHLVTVDSPATMDIAGKLRRLIQDMWFPVHNFVRPEATVSWVGVETHMPRAYPPADGRPAPPAKRKRVDADRADSLFHREAAPAARHSKCTASSRVMCHLTKEWRPIGEMECITTVLEGDLASSEEIVASAPVSTRFRRRPDSFRVSPPQAHPACARWTALREKLAAGPEAAELRLTVTIRKTYVRFVKTLFSVVLAQQSVRQYLRRDAAFADCGAIVALDEAVIARHVGDLLRSLADGRQYVIKNCERLKEAVGK